LTDYLVHPLDVFVPLIGGDGAGKANDPLLVVVHQALRTVSYSLLTYPSEKNRFANYPTI
jgi:hypothetical protein